MPNKRWNSLRQYSCVIGGNLSNDTGYGTLLDGMKNIYNLNSLSVQGQRLSKVFALVLLSNHHVDTVGLVHSQTGSWVVNIGQPCCWIYKIMSYEIFIYCWMAWKTILTLTPEQEFWWYSCSFNNIWIFHSCTIAEISSYNTNREYCLCELLTYLV